MREPPLTATQRAYLLAFDDFLLARTSSERRTARQAMDGLFLDICEEAGIEPERMPTLALDEAVEASA